ncbi:MAG: DUF1800 domain-containing protein [Planctomycetes bacterium]|nr:DUF1800 domain-containing protein [Planctomycetota bacterium]
MPAAYFAVLLLALASTLGAQRTRELEDREKILHVLNRLSFGADDEAVAEVEEMGLEAWIDDQLETSYLDAATLKRLEGYATLGLDNKGIYAAYGSKGDTVDKELLGAIVLRAVYARGQIAEVMADFWRNHFNVDRAKASVRFTATDWDREVIRANALGNFGDMLMASAKHPAMLVYLDNYISRRPPNKTELKSVARNVRRTTGSKERGDEAAEIAAQRGINENYARELMELHTLGVDNGYEQRDVIDLARALTGWTVATDGNKYEFDYQDSMHDHGDKFVLGRSFAREKRRNGMQEGERIIEFLASHQETARFVARKLCMRLVGDAPSPKLIESTAVELRKSGFDFKRALKHILDSDEFYDPACYRAKFKTPVEFVFSALRAVDAEIEDPAAVVAVIREMGQPLYGCEDPTGWDDRAEAWRDPGVMAVRWKFAMDLALGKVRGVTVPDSFFAGLQNQAPSQMVLALGRKVLAGELRSDTISALIKMSRRHERRLKEAEDDRLQALVEGKKPKPNDLPPLERMLLGTLLGSPEFQEQ